MTGQIGEAPYIAADLRKYARWSFPKKAWAMNCAAEILETLQCEPMAAGEDGWSEWVHPMPGYQMQCCGCGLVHEVAFAIRAKGRVPAPPANEGEDDEALIVFRMRRAQSIIGLGRDPQGSPQ